MILQLLPLYLASIKFQGPLFENSCVDVLESEIYSTDGLYLGTIGWMRERFNEMIKSEIE